MDGIVTGGDVKRSGFDDQVPAFICYRQAVIPGADGEVRVHDAQRIVHVKTVFRRGHADGPAGDDQVIIGINAVLVSGGYGQGAGTVDGQVVFGENCSAGTVSQCCFTHLRAGGQDVFASFCQGQEDLVRFLHPDAGVITAGDVHPIQFDPNLGGVIGIHADEAIVQSPGDHIGSSVGDDHRAAVHIGAFAGNRSAVPIERDDRRVFALPLTILVIGGEV